MKLYKDQVTGKVEAFNIRGTYDREVVRYIPSETEFEELEDGTKVPVMEEVNETVTEEFYCHDRGEEHWFETMDWFLKVLGEHEGLTEDDIEFKRVRLSKEQRDRLELPEVQELDERTVGDAFTFVGEGEFPYYEDPETGKKVPVKKHALSVLENKMKAVVLGSQVGELYLANMDLAKTTAEQYMQIEELSTENTKLSNTITELYMQIMAAEQ